MGGGVASGGGSPGGSPRLPYMRSLRAVTFPFSDFACFAPDLVCDFLEDSSQWYLLFFPL